MDNNTTAAQAELKFTVEVWFATGRDYVAVGSTPDLNLACNTFRRYLGADARGVRIVDANGNVIEQGR